MDFKHIWYTDKTKLFLSPWKRHIPLEKGTFRPSNSNNSNKTWEFGQEVSHFWPKILSQRLSGHFWVLWSKMGPFQECAAIPTVPQAHQNRVTVVKSMQNPPASFAICDCDAHRGPQKSLAISKTLHRDLRVRWKVASDLRFRVAISESKSPSFCRISGDLAPSTRNR